MIGNKEEKGGNDIYEKARILPFQTAEDVRPLCCQTDDALRLNLLNSNG